MNRYIIVPTTIATVYDDIEKAKREVEVLHIEKPEESYYIAKLIAGTETRLSFHFFEEMKKERKKRTVEVTSPTNLTSTNTESMDVPVTPTPGESTLFIPARCKFDDKAAVTFMEMDDGTTAYLCAEHSK